jgi:hypothetical protein
LPRSEYFATLEPWAWLLNTNHSKIPPSQLGVTHD